MPLMASPQRVNANSSGESSSESSGENRNDEMSTIDRAVAATSEHDCDDDKHYENAGSDSDSSEDDDDESEQDEDDDDDDGVVGLIAQIRRQTPSPTDALGTRHSFDGRHETQTIQRLINQSPARLSASLSPPPLRAPTVPHRNNVVVVDSRIDAIPAQERAAATPYRPQSGSPRYPLPRCARVAVVEYLGNPAVSHQFVRALEHIFEQHGMSVSVSTGKSLDQSDSWSPRARSLSFLQMPLDEWNKRRESERQ